MVLLEFEFSGSGVPIGKYETNVSTTWQDVFTYIESVVWNDQTYKVRLFTSHDLKHECFKHDDFDFQEDQSIIVLRMTDPRMAEFRAKIEANPQVLVDACYQNKPILDIQHLLGAKADPNIQAGYGYDLTTLHWASYYGRDDMARTLLDAKADPNV
jgi:hypothetical protein